MTLLRAPQEAEILVAIVAGQIMAGVVTSGAPYDESDVVDLADDIVREVYSRGYSDEEVASDPS